jgi:hypothetical protein
MTTPADDSLPQPRDITLEQATPEQLAELEEQSRSDDEGTPDGGTRTGG